MNPNKFWNCAHYFYLLNIPYEYFALCTYVYRPHPKDGGRYCFQFVCQSTPWGGVPQPGLDGGGVTPARSGWDGMGWEYASQVWMVGGGEPQPGLDKGVPQPGLDGGGGIRPGLDGGYPSQVWMVGSTPGTLPHTP